MAKKQSKKITTWKFSTERGEISVDVRMTIWSSGTKFSVDCIVPGAGNISESHDNIDELKKIVAEKLKQVAMFTWRPMYLVQLQWSKSPLPADDRMGASCSSDLSLTVTQVETAEAESDGTMKNYYRYVSSRVFEGLPNTGPITETFGFVEHRREEIVGVSALVPRTESVKKGLASLSAELGAIMTACLKSMAPDAIEATLAKAAKGTRSFVPTKS